MRNITVTSSDANRSCMLQSVLGKVILVRRNWRDHKKVVASRQCEAETAELRQQKRSSGVRAT